MNLKHPDRDVKKIQRLWNEAVDEVLNDTQVQHPDTRVEDQAKINRAKDILRNSSTASIFLDWAEKNDVAIWLDHQLDPEHFEGFVFIGTNTVVVSAKLSEAQLASTIAHELVHVWQDHNNLLPSVIYDPLETLIKSRMTEAAAFSIQTLVFAELKENGLDIKASYFKDRTEQEVTAMADIFKNSSGIPKEHIAYKSFAEFPKSYMGRYYDRSFSAMILGSLLSVKDDMDGEENTGENLVDISTYLSHHIPYFIDWDIAAFATAPYTIEDTLIYGALPNGENVFTDKDGAPYLTEEDISRFTREPITLEVAMMYGCATSLFELLDSPTILTQPLGQRQGAPKNFYIKK